MVRARAARAAAGAAHDYVAKMDQDAYVWPLELHAHVQGFAAARFYGGATWRHPAGNRRPGRAFEHVNGGFAVVPPSSRARARAAREQPRPVDGSAARLSQPPHGRWLARANEDVAVRCSSRAERRAGVRAEPNGAIRSRGWPRPAGTRSVCPWRHAADLKEPANYRCWGALRYASAGATRARGG